MGRPTHARTLARVCGPCGRVASALGARVRVLLVRPALSHQVRNQYDDCKRNKMRRKGRQPLLPKINNNHLAEARAAIINPLQPQHRNTSGSTQAFSRAPVIASQYSLAKN
jgi:hypothetical protein